MRLISAVASKEATPGQMLYYLLNSPSRSAPPPPCEAELRAVRATCHESHVHPNLRALIKCRCQSRRVATRSAISFSAAGLKLTRLLGPDLAFLPGH